jgi:hypothetical protein
MLRSNNFCSKFGISEIMSGLSVLDPTLSIDGTYVIKIAIP